MVEGMVTNKATIKVAPAIVVIVQIMVTVVAMVTTEATHQNRLLVALGPKSDLMLTKVAGNKDMPVLNTALAVSEDGRRIT